jgi:hypothetical protein
MYQYVNPAAGAAANATAAAGAGGQGLVRLKHPLWWFGPVWSGSGYGSGGWTLWDAVASQVQVAIGGDEQVYVPEARNCSGVDDKHCLFHLTQQVCD